VYAASASSIACIDLVASSVSFEETSHNTVWQTRRRILCKRGFYVANPCNCGELSVCVYVQRDGEGRRKVRESGMGRTSTGKGKWKEREEGQGGEGKGYLRAKQGAHKKRQGQDGHQSMNVLKLHFIEYLKLHAV